MDSTVIVNEFLSELRRGSIVLSALASLRRPAYGYSLIERLSGTGIGVEANTLYPLLRRLEGQGLLSSVWNTQGAKPRKYYALTEFGEQVLIELTRAYRASVAAMNEILEDCGV